VVQAVVVLPPSFRIVAPSVIDEFVERRSDSVKPGDIVDLAPLVVGMWKMFRK